MRCIVSCLEGSTSPTLHFGLSGFQGFQDSPQAQFVPAVGELLVQSGAASHQALQRQLPGVRGVSSTALWFWGAQHIDRLVEVCFFQLGQVPDTTSPIAVAVVALDN
jgi:hypothetical protein